MHTGVNEDICIVLSYLNDAKFCDGKVVNFNQQSNFSPLLQHKSTDNHRKIEQRSEEWFNVRQGATVTGSTIYKAVGCDGLKKMREHYDNVLCKEKSPDVPKGSQDAMKYGTENEVNAMATFVGSILPI